MATPYSTWRKAGGTYYISGQLPVDPETGSMPQGMGAQTEAALANLERALTDIGCTREHVVKTTVFIRDFSRFAEFNEAYAAFFSEPYPARSAFQVAGLAPGADIEIEAIAVKED